MSSLVSSHTLDCKITGLAKLMAGKIHTTLLLTDLTKVASETSLMSPSMIAYHRPFENISPDDDIQGTENRGIATIFLPTLNKYDYTQSLILENTHAGL